MALKTFPTLRNTLRRGFILSVLAVVPLAFSPAAAAQVVRDTFPFDTTITNCGNTIHISGNVVATFHFVEKPNGGFLATAHFVPRQVRGTDEFGRRYIANGLTRDTFIVTPRGGLVSTFINRFHIVGTRDAPTYYVKETFHVTITPAGKLTADVARFSVTCR
jgi:hypothetical protein